MKEHDRTLLERLDTLTRRSDVRALIDAYALSARARLAGDPVAAMSWSAIPAKRFPADMPDGIASAWVFVVRRGRASGCHMHPNSVQRSFSYEGRGTMLVGPPDRAERISLVDDPQAPLEQRTCVIGPKTYHDAEAGDRDWVVVSFHTVSANTLAEIGYGATEGTSAGFEYGESGARSAEVTQIRVDPRCQREATPYPRVPQPEEFGRIFTHNMFRMVYHSERGWHDQEIVPLENLSLHPATSVFHYGQEIFEGLKAYRLDEGGVGIFRADTHGERMRLSALRMAMPPVDPALFVTAVKALVSMDKGRMPEDPRASLYIRPVLFGADMGLGVQPASQYLFLIFCCIVGQYSGATSRPMRILVMRDYIRAAPGGTGAAKAGGNYGGSLLGIREAKEQGFDQVLWLDALHRRDIEELGAMNFFAVFGKHLVTPPAGSTILTGVTRDSILTLAPSLGYTVEERALSIDEVMEGARSGKLTEAFAAGTAAVVSPVGEIVDGHRKVHIGHGEAGEVARRLAEVLGDIRSGRAPDPYGWVLRV
jgi:branched-chain amino acid aminotransferase